MDGSRFDELAKSLSAQRSRRGVLGALAAAAFGTLGFARAAEAAACRSAGNSCSANGDCCSKNCVAESRTRKICHCVSSGDCPAGDQCHAAVCSGGGCGLAVTTGAGCDDGDRCTTGDVCHANGSCAGTPVVCSATNECFTAGPCQAIDGQCPAQTYHGDGAACSLGVCFSNACCAPVSQETTCNLTCGPQVNNCGETVECTPCCIDAGGACSADGDCCSSVCVVVDSVGTCQSGKVILGAACDEDSDCLSGHCCSGFCRDITGDPANCGSCGGVCSSINMATQTCVAGVCDGTCASGFANCDNTLRTNGCNTNLNFDEGNCGSCGHSCAAANATATCSGGQCFLTACTAGYTDCDDLPANGCEVHTDIDPDNCGACGSVCAAGANATYATCASGTCTQICVAGYADCDGLKANGCEVNTQTNANHCGACGIDCAIGESCVSGVCQCGDGPACAGGTYCSAGACVANCPADTCSQSCLCVGGPSGNNCLSAGGRSCDACARDSDCPLGSVCGYAYYIPDGRLEASPFDDDCQLGYRGYCVEIETFCAP